jgi:hypothetical protein
MRQGSSRNEEVISKFLNVLENVKNRDKLLSYTQLFSRANSEIQFENFQQTEKLIYHLKKKVYISKCYYWVFGHGLKNKEGVV